MTDLADRWIEVSRGALEHNLAQVRSLLKPGVLLMAVVKANAYGHGVEAARVLAEAGAECLAVTHLSEALELREAGIRSKILVFSPLLPGQIEAALDADLTLTVVSAEGAG
ncbi:MAG: alanine racemase, partial [Armatimonadota bacterium]|nr:alanine racemase [Armatimonadota bacterium]